MVENEPPRRMAEPPGRSPGAASPERPDDSAGFQVKDRRWWAQPGQPESAAPGESKPTYVASLEAEIERLGKLVEEKDQIAREAAVRARGSSEELERAKERIRKEAARDLEQKKRDILIGFIDVLDDLDRAIEATRQVDRDSPVIEGVELVRRSFLAKLERFGAAPMPSLGQPFEPSRHEALSVVPVHDPAQDGVVLGVMREGYLIGDEVLRPAAVAVGKLEH